MRRLPLSFLLLLLASCYDSAGEPGMLGETPPSSGSLAELRRLYVGETFEVQTDLVVTGVVTSDDQAGNFYRSLTIEHQGAAAELMAGIDGLHNIYPVGYHLTISLRGLSVGENHGILQIGRPPAAGSGYATDYLGSRAALDGHVTRGGAGSAPRPLATTIPELTPTMAGRLVRLDGLHYAPGEPEENAWSGTRRFSDDEGLTVYTYTRPYADFAEEEIPFKRLVLVGILQYDSAKDGSARYTLRLRDETDCWY